MRSALCQLQVTLHNREDEAHNVGTRPLRLRPLGRSAWGIRKTKLPAVAVLPYASAEHADPKAQATAIKAVSKGYGLKVDVKDLEYDAADIKKEIGKRLQQTARYAGDARLGR